MRNKPAAPTAEVLREKGKLLGVKLNLPTAGREIFIPYPKERILAYLESQKTEVRPFQREIERKIEAAFGLETNLFNKKVQEYYNTLAEIIFLEDTERAVRGLLGNCPAVETLKVELKKVQLNLSKVIASLKGRP